MNKRFSFVVLAMIVVASLILSACGAAATQAPVATEAPATEAPTEAPVATEAPASDVGTPEHPIKVLFVPSVDANIITTGGQVMADALNKATGLTFEVTVPTSYAATVEEMCASPSDTMAFIPGLGYAIASQLCGCSLQSHSLWVSSVLG